MSLNIGELVAKVTMDDSEYQKKSDDLPKKTEGKFGKLMPIAATAGVAVGAALVSGVAGAIEKDSINDKMAAQLGLTEEQSKKSGEVAGRLYAGAYGDSYESVVDAVGAVQSSIEGMRNASDSELEAVTAKVMDLSTAFDIDMARAAQVAGQAVSSGLVDNVDEGLDLLTAALQKVPANVREDVLDAVDEYGPFMDSIGLKGEEAFSLLADSAEKGMFGIDKTGDALKEFTIRSTDMSDATTQAYKDLGLNSKEMTDALLAGGDQAKGAFDKIIGGLQGMKDPAAQSQAALALFGTPLEDLNVSEIPAFIDSLAGVKDSLGETDGAAAALGDTLNSNTSTSWESLRRQFEMILNGVGQMLLPLLEQFTSWALENPQILQVVVIALGAIAVALGIAAAAQWAMNSALLASPITWIIVGIVALIAALVLLWQNWDTVVAWLKEVWDGFVSWLSDSLSALAEWWSGVWESISSFFSDLWTSVTDWFKSTWQAVVDWFTSLVDGVAAWWSGVWQGISDFFRSIWDGIKSYFNEAVERVKSIISAGWEVLKTIISWNPLVLIISKWDEIKSFMSGLKEKVVEFIKAGWERLKDIIGFDPLQGIKDLWNKVIDWFGNLPQSIVDKIGNLKDKISGIFKTAFNAVAGFWNNSVGKIGFTVPDWVPGVGGKSFSVPSIPLLASGGVATAATLAMIGEGGESEAIVPLSKFPGMVKSAMKEAGFEMPHKNIAPQPVYDMSGNPTSVQGGGERHFHYHEAPGTQRTEDDILTALSKPKTRGF